MKRILLILLFTSSAFAEPTVTSIEPSSAPASGGVFVHIYGTDLVGFALACPSIECANYVKFGDELGGIAVNLSNEIVVLAPPHGPGTVDLTVNIAGKKKIVLPAAFVYEASASDDTVPVLIPIVAARAAGAFGSIWQSETSFTNNSESIVAVEYGTCPGQGLICHDIFVEPHKTVTAALVDLGQTISGVFVHVPRSQLDSLDIQLRIQDLSRQSQTWGTTIPIVRNTDFRPIVRLHNVPTDPAFRSTLRIYKYSDEFSAVQLRVLDESTGELLLSDTVTTLPRPISQIVGHDRLRIEVQSAADPPIPIWAFVSVTNNETQHVTVIAPSP